MPILEDGQLFERYRVHKWLGSGVAGESYEAEDRILQRKVTLKLIHPWTTLSDSARRQFFREMQGISLLNHPYLATVLDYGEIEGRIYVARRYVSSGSLLGNSGRLWFHPPLAVAEAFAYAHQLAQVLQYIHQHGYVHGSLAFANVLVLRGPNLEKTSEYAPFLVADIGLAHFVRRFGHPRLETLPISAAPEQLNKRVVPASDQFALAVLLYFWLAGRPPYLGASYEIERQKRSETITPLSTLNPGITQAQDSLILRAMRANPEDRHPSVLAFAEALLASLTSPSQYVPANDAPLPATETPRERLQPVSSEQPAVPAAEAQAISLPQDAARATTERGGETPAQSKAEPYRSALEELLASSQARAEQQSGEPEAGTQPEEESIELSQPEYSGFFPRLPETPRVDEHILQADLSQLTSANEASELPAARQTGPLAAEPENYLPASEPAAPQSDSAANPLQPPPAVQEESEQANSQPVLPDERQSEKPAEERADTAASQETSATSAETTVAFLSSETAIHEASKEIEPYAERREEGANTPALDGDLQASVTGQALPSPEMEARSNGEEQALEIPPALASAEGEFTDTPAVSEYASVAAQPDAATFEGEEEITSASEIDVAEKATSLLSRPETVQEPGIATLPLEELSPVEEAEPDADENLNTVPLVEAEEAEVAQQAAETLLAATPLDEAEAAKTPLDPEGTGKNQAAFSTVPLAEANTASEESAASAITDQPARSDEVTAASAENAPPIFSTQTSSPDADSLPSSSEESALSAPAAEIAMPGEATQTEPETISDAVVAQPEQPGASSQDLDLNSPLRESLENTNATYSPIDEAIAVPRLIIASPYTSSSFEFLIVDEEINIGRAGSSNLYLEQDNLTSRHHALLKRIGERVLIFDKRSHNGVFLNGQKIEVGRGYELADGDHIGIGNYELIFRSASTGQISQLI